MRDGALDSDDQQRLRQDLAAAFRLCHRFGWSESVGNHFSAAVSADGRRFLLNPRWQHFATLRASDLLLRDENDRQIADFLARTGDAEDRTERPAGAAPVAAGWQLLTRDNGPDGFYLACLHKRKAADDNKVTDQRS